MLEEEELSKNALTKMPKLDSFMRESQRINGSGLGMFFFFHSINIDLHLPT